jgi:hypothetical protein
VAWLYGVCHSSSSAVSSPILIAAIFAVVSAFQHSCIDASRSHSM